LFNVPTSNHLNRGYHDGPQCFARTCPSAPITIEAGTYGEQDCPNLFLCLEVTVLGGCYSSCCAFDVSRRYQRAERGLSIDPTEHRQSKCIQFFSRIMNNCFKLGCCMCVSSCLLKVCAPDSAGAQELSGETGRAARACCRIAHTLWKGILWTRVLGMGCMTTQMVIEANSEWDGRPKARPDLMEAPKAKTMMDRGAPPTGDDRTVAETVVEPADMLMPWEEDAEQERRKRQQQTPHSQQMNRGG
jgi:hypothetical protein